MKTRTTPDRFTDEDASPVLHEITLLSEAALAEDWNREEERAAWAYLKKDAVIVVHIRNP